MWVVVMTLPKVIEEATILSQQEVAPAVYRLVLRAPNIARTAQPGQFLEVQLTGSNHVLRRPLGLAEKDEREGSVTLFYRVVGQGTAFLTQKKSGEALSLLGPLGHGFDLSFSQPLLVGGGMGLSPLLSYAQQRPGACDILMGGRTARELFWQEFYQALVEKIFLTTDDGSLGTKGFVTNLLPSLLAKKSYDGILVCGPEIMMRGVAKIAREAGVRCQVSLEKRMACGLGACLSCSLDTTSGERKKVCKDGPVFWAEEVFA